MSARCALRANHISMREYERALRAARIIYQCANMIARIIYQCANMIALRAARNHISMREYDRAARNHIDICIY